MTTLRSRLPGFAVGFVALALAFGLEGQKWL